jgi:hypothetical protein
MTGQPDLQKPTSAHRERLVARSKDQDRTLEAMHQLEAALGGAAPGRETDWLHDVLAALESLDQVTSEEQRNADEVDSLLSDIVRSQPRLRHRVHGLRSQYAHVRTTIDGLRHELTASRDPLDPDVHDIRDRLTWLLTALRHQRVRESDLIYEAYYEAFDTELSS